MSAQSFFHINNQIGETLSFVTTASSATTFDPSVLPKSSKNPRWDLGDGTAISTNNVSHTYSDSGDSKTVTLSIDRLTNIQTINLSNDEIVGTLDVSDLTECVNFRANGNSGLSALTLPNSTADINTFWFFFCDLREIDFTKIPNFGGSVSCFSNSNLTGVTLPSASTESFSQFRFENCDIQGRIDLSGYTGLGGLFDISNNTGITGLTLPAVSNNFTTFSINGIGISGPLDLTILSGLGGSIQINSINNITSIDFPESTNTTTLALMNTMSAITYINMTGMSGLGGSITIQGNNNLSAVTLPNSSQSITSISISTCPALREINFSSLSGVSGIVSASNNDIMSAATLPYTDGILTNVSMYSDNISTYVDMKTLTGNTHDDIDIKFEANAIPTADVNHMLVDLDNFGWTGGSINISGGSNGAPDGSSGGFDGTGATASLVSKGWTVTTN